MLRIATILLASTIVLPGMAQAAGPFHLMMTDAKIGVLPEGWTAAKTGEGPGSVWKVQADASVPGGKVLAQTSADGPKRLFNLCVADKPKFRDVDISVAFKANAGKIDQGGGVVWRYKDAKNYYVARINPLEPNYRLYKVVDGKRTKVATAELKVPAGRWHVLHVVQQGNHIQCFFGNKKYLDVKDDTFPDAGKIGVWTKADAQTSFTALKAEEKPAKERKQGSAKE
ncbi:MAG: family 16 glycoside hydrolase [Thermoguttaceae bacterium]